MAKRPRQTDVIVIGAGPAGSLAALVLARAGKSVELVDSAKFPRSKPCAGWINARAVKLLHDLDINLKVLDARAVDDAVFLSADLAKQATPQGPSDRGMVVDRGTFDALLARTAEKAGANFRHRTKVTHIQTTESGVTVELDGAASIEGRVLVLATGIARGLLRDLDLQLPTNEATWCSAHVTAKSAPDVDKKRQRMIVVFEGTAAGGCAIALENKDTANLTLFAQSDRASGLQRLGEIAAGLQRKGLLKTDLAQAAASGTWTPTHPFDALDVDSHVGKFSLVVGDAGGFRSTVSHEGIYPAMWSAQIAARVIGKMEASNHPQDVLATYDREWRLEMADFLRPPNTDLQLLLPLIFTNAPMAERMAAAFFLGENI